MRLGHLLQTTLLCSDTRSLDGSAEAVSSFWRLAMLHAALQHCVLRLVVRALLGVLTLLQSA